MEKLKSSLLAVVIILGLLIVTRPAAAQQVSSVRDNDANAVIKGGCLTVNECQQKVLNDRSAANILSCFGIGDADMRNLDKTAVVGEVTSSNTVLVDGKVVATNAITGGRQNIPGSTRSTCGNFPFFMRPPSVSFVSSPLTAFVVMDSNDQFEFAILTACGNGVKATPVKKVVKPTPAPAVTKPAAPTQQQQQQQQQTVVINNGQPVAAQQQQQSTPAQAQTQTTPAPTKALPNTGPGAVLGFSLLAGSFGTIGHFFYQRNLRRI